MAIIGLLIITFIVSTLTTIDPISSTECPFSCHCYQQSGINSIFCARTDLSQIPNYFDFDVKILNFTDNLLTNLTDAFHNQHYKSLEIMDLSHNSLAYIDERSLHQLKNLLEIDLSNNHIVSIPPRLFDKNRFLNTAHFRGNPIEQLVDYAFAPSIYMRRLNFQGCRIKNIRKFAFVNTPLLEYLNLKDNDLKSLSSSVLHFTSQLKDLRLEGNPWHCDKKLWHLLKWVRGKNVANSSMLCVYGETDNAILWDTMDVENGLKFRDTEVPANVKKIRWSRARTKSHRRQLSPVAPADDEQRQRQRRDRNVDQAPHRDSESSNNDYEKLDPQSEGANENDEEDPESDEDYNFVEGEFRNYSHTGRDFADTDDQKTENNVPHRAIFHYNQNGDPKLTIQYDAAKLSKQTSQHQNQPIHSDWSLHNTLPNSNIDNNLALQRSKQTISQRLDDPKQPASLETNSAGIAKHGDEIIEESETINGFTISTSLDFRKNKNAAEQQQVEDNDYQLNGTEVKSIFATTNAEDGDEVNLKYLLCVIAGQFLLLAVLLAVLYRLCQSRLRREAVTNAPLNNNKNARTNEIQSPGYKRYSLSEEDFYADLRKSKVDEGKCDSESGYLSYHRYNSIEGETSNDGMHFRRNQRDENDALSAYTIAEIDSGNGIEPNAETTDRGMRRNSSMRSTGRRVKINIARRSYSDDLKNESVNL